MLQELLGLVGLVMLVYCLVDCIQTDASLVRNLPKVGWVVLIVVLPVAGGIAWLVAGRPERLATSGRGASGRPESSGGPWPDTRPTARAAIEQQIDVRLREERARVDREHEEALRRWEASERERAARPAPPPAGD